MYNFASDYLEGAHPQVMEALNKTNFIQTVGYGEDQYCQKAKDKIKAILENENVDIHFLVGGTQTNMIMISSALKDYQAVIAVDSGHINVHETGAVEFTGHKILTKPHQDGKMIPEMIDEIMREHPDDRRYSHGQDRPPRVHHGFSGTPSVSELHLPQWRYLCLPDR